MKKLKIDCLNDFASVVNIKEVIPATDGDLICIQTWCGENDSNGEWLSIIFPITFKLYVESDYETELYLLAAYHGESGGEIEYAPICSKSIIQYNKEGSVYNINYKRYIDLMTSIGQPIKPFKEYLKEFITGEINDHCISLKD